MKMLIWLIVGIIIFGVIVYANPQVWEDVKGKVTELQKIKLPNLESCPQIDVPMGDLGIDGKIYDGWTIKGGKPKCRKGNREDENVNMYYCGGYSYDNFLGYGEVNIYVEKTFISDEGNIGKTYKYVLWNIYDENRDFVETRCLGNPDEFYRKQDEAFYNEFMKLGGY